MGGTRARPLPCQSRCKNRHPNSWNCSAARTPRVTQGTSLSSRQRRDQPVPREGIPPSRAQHPSSIFPSSHPRHNRPIYSFGFTHPTWQANFSESSPKKADSSMSLGRRRRRKTPMPGKKGKANSMFLTSSRRPSLCTRWGPPSLDGGHPLRNWSSSLRNVQFLGLSSPTSPKYPLFSNFLQFSGPHRYPPPETQKRRPSESSAPPFPSSGRSSTPELLWSLHTHRMSARRVSLFARRAMPVPSSPPLAVLHRPLSSPWPRLILSRVLTEREADGVRAYLATDETRENSRQTETMGSLLDGFAPIALI
jgi:hypothetical protein